MLINSTNGRYHAIYSAYINIAFGILEFILAMQAGSDDDSFSLFGVALMAFVDIVGSLLVLIRWQCAYVNDQQVAKAREMNFSIVIGFLMITLGLYFLHECISSLWRGSSPNSASEGMTVALIGSIGSFSLAGYKYVVGKALDSYVVLTDALCSLCLALTCLSSIFVLYLDGIWWWADGVLGLAVALYTLLGGINTMIHSFNEIRYLSRNISSDYDEVYSHDKLLYLQKEEESHPLLSSSCNINSNANTAFPSKADKGYSLAHISQTSINNKPKLTTYTKIPQNQPIDTHSISTSSLASSTSTSVIGIENTIVNNNHIKSKSSPITSSAPSLTSVALRQSQYSSFMPLSMNRTDSLSEGDSYSYEGEGEGDLDEAVV